MKALFRSPWLGVALIALGVAGLVWPDLSFTKARHDATLGPLAFTVRERETIQVPVWLGLGLVAAGTTLLLRSRTRA